MPLPFDQIWRVSPPLRARHYAGPNHSSEILTAGVLTALPLPKGATGICPVLGKVTQDFSDLKAELRRAAGQKPLT